MNISKLNCSQTFGKTPVMSCVVKKSGKKEPIKAVLYKMDSTNPYDLLEVSQNHTSLCLFSDMKEDADIKRDYYYSYPQKEYFILSDTTNGNVISCAETSNHFRKIKRVTEEEFTCESTPHKRERVEGSYLSVDELNKNNNYLNPTAPLVSYLVNKAMYNDYSSIVISTSNLDGEDLKRVRFNKAENGEWYMPSRKYKKTIEAGKKKFNIVI